MEEALVAPCAGVDCRASWPALPPCEGPRNRWHQTFHTGGKTRAKIHHAVYFRPSLQEATPAVAGTPSRGTALVIRDTKFRSRGVESPGMVSTTGHDAVHRSPGGSLISHDPHDRGRDPQTTPSPDKRDKTRTICASKPTRHGGEAFPALGVVAPRPSGEAGRELLTPEDVDAVLENSRRVQRPLAWRGPIWRALDLRPAPHGRHRSRPSRFPPANLVVAVPRFPATLEGSLLLERLL